MTARRIINLASPMTTIGRQALPQMPPALRKADVLGETPDNRGRATAYGVAEALANPIQVESGTWAEAIAEALAGGLRGRAARDERLGELDASAQERARALYNDEQAANREIKQQGTENEYRNRVLSQDQSQFEASQATQRRGQDLGVGRIYSPPISGMNLGLGPGMYQQSPEGRYEPVNTQRGSPLERAQATADVERVGNFRSAADTDMATVAELDRFAGLNAQEPGTGPNNPQAMGIGGWRPLANEHTQQMVQIISRLTPQQRVPGSGATSDFDARMFQEALPGINRSRAANDAIIGAYRARAALSNDRVNVAEAWLESGSLSGLDGTWRRYVRANPIFDPNSTPDNPRLNPNRQDFMTWAQANNVQIGAAASEGLAPASPAPAASPSAPRVGAIEDGFRFKGGDPADPNSWEPVR